MPRTAAPPTTASAAPENNPGPRPKPRHGLFGCNFALIALVAIAAVAARLIRSARTLS